MNLDELLELSERQVCADALLSAGEVQGQVMAMQLRGLRDEAAEQELESLVRLILHGEAATDGETVVLEWDRGFVSAVRWPGYEGWEFLEQGLLALIELLSTPAELVQALPWNPKFGAVERVKARRALMHLRTVHLGPYEIRPSMNDLWRLIGEHPLPPMVKELIVADVPHRHRDEHQITWLELGNVSLAWPGLRQLESLSLRGSWPLFGEIDLPALKRFAIETSTLSSVDEFRAARWPKLESLSLSFGDDRYNPTPCPLEDVKALIRELPTSLKHLGLRNATFTEQLIPVLARSMVLPHLESLDLTWGVLLDGAPVLLEHATALRHLHRLDVTDTGLQDFVEVQRAIPGLFRGSEWRTKTHRYVSISE
ncbi:MAG: hypothetical protein U0228_28365 [Myxococcaceae bacterium]